MTQTQEKQFQLVNYANRTFTQQELLDLQSKGVLFNYANKHDLSEVSPFDWSFTGADVGVLCKEYNVVENEENINLFMQLIGETKENQMQYTFKPGDEVIITVPKGTLADEYEPGGEYIDEDMLTWTEGYIDRFGATIHKNNSIRVYKPDGSDYWNFPVSWLKLKNPPENVNETQEQEITLESLDKQILEAALNVEHLENLREVFLNARTLGYKLTKA